MIDKNVLLKQHAYNFKPTSLFIIKKLKVLHKFTSILYYTQYRSDLTYQI